MKRYRLKLDSPWGKKGKIIEVVECQGFTMINNIDCVGGFAEPDKYPELLELVIEPSEIDVNMLNLKTIIKDALEYEKIRDDATKTLVDRVKELEDALKFYADREQYKIVHHMMTGHGGEIPIELDKGEKAREALKAKAKP